MNIAYVISAYKHLDQLARLVRRLDFDGASFFIHVDAKTRTSEFEAARTTLRACNVHFLERHSCSWGGFGHVRSTLKGIAAAVEGGRDFDVVILLTGQDYPIKPNESIHRYFDEHPGRSFVESFPLPQPTWAEEGWLERIEYWHFPSLGKNVRFPPRIVGRVVRQARRRFPASLVPYGGSSYWCLTRTCAEYVHAFVLRHPDLVHFFEHVRIPDEIFFQTILLNSPLREEIVNDDLRYVDWTHGRSSPRLLTAEDLPRLASSQKLFARKFDQTRDRVVLDLIDRTLLGLTSEI